MPFDYKAYSAHCATLNKSQLQAEITSYQQSIHAAGAGTWVALLAVPITMGVSALAITGTAPAILNAKKKQKIAMKYLATAPDPSEGPRPVLGRPLAHRNPVQTNRRRASNEDDLPAYIEEDAEHTVLVGDGRGMDEDVVVEVNVDGEGHLPSYDEATLKRLSTLRLRDSERPLREREGMGQVPPVSEEVEERRVS